ncbi:MAG TPA: cupin domain-containing protein [Candidatus Omnitrophota bacterium]|nr:cupin domain-containing protein [Candidatus Omnitrophota bacterium]
MSLVKVEKPNARRIDELKIKTWPVWEKGISRFEWSYEEKEVCYFLEGAASVECPDGSVVSFGKGDLVTFPEGLKCTWDIQKPVRKHYCFG